MADTRELQASVLFQVKDHVAVVTGGGSGIGLMAAQALAANGRTADTKTAQDKLEAAAKAHNPSGSGSIIPTRPCDVGDKKELERLVEEISAKEKTVDILVLAAGQPGPKAEPSSDNAQEMKKTLWENETPQGWNDTYNADVTSLYFTTVAFLPLLQASAESDNHWSSSVITISSMSGMIRHSQGHFAYNAAKGATVHLTKLMSAEFMKLRIRVNSIAPGYFPSELTAKESDEKQKSELQPSYVQDKGHVPMNRPGVDEEIAQAVLFLAKNQYTTGQILAVEGGVLNVLGS